MARKFLMMGWTRARRYANHRDGKKATIIAESITGRRPLDMRQGRVRRIFKEAYDEARKNEAPEDVQWRASE